MSLIPPDYLNAVVSLDLCNGNECKSIATGFFVGKPTGTKNDVGELYRVFLVTNRHVFEDKNGTLLKEVHVRMNTSTGDGKRFVVRLLDANGKPIWLRHKDEKIDLAILPIDAQYLNQEGINYHFFQGSDLFYAKDFSQNNISIGDGLFVMGFPRGINGKLRNSVILRHGIIARVDDEILQDGFFYIDAAAYPGNSGGPVIHKPEVVSITGTSCNSSAGLVGVISSGETYSDVAISQQTGEARMVLTEQMGLVRVVPVERIFEIIDLASVDTVVAGNNAVVDKI